MSPTSIGAIVPPHNQKQLENREPLWLLKKILILEDDSIVRINLETYLRRSNFDVTATTSLAGARECLARDHFDVLFLDMRLPDGDGTELLKEMQGRPQNPLVVVTTGFGSVESAVDCMKNGAFDYLIKPFTNEQIAFVLRKAEDFNQLIQVNRLLSR